MKKNSQRPGCRSPAVSGLFYPDRPATLRTMVSGFLAEARGQAGPPKALIAPHAGFEYSGPIAGSAYATLAPHRATTRRVILLGPSHHVAFSGLAVSGASTFETPLGDVPVDDELRRRALEYSQVRIFEPAHLMEHSLETHLPFLQMALDRFAILPLVVGEAEPDAISEVLEAVWGGPETLVDISSDLSHYLDYEAAQRLDAKTSRAIEAMTPHDISPPQACGRLPIQGLLLAAARHHLQARTLDVRNSGDTAGPRDRVVGYGAYVFV